MAGVGAVKIKSDKFLMIYPNEFPGFSLYTTRTRQPYTNSSKSSSLIQINIVLNAMKSLRVQLVTSTSDLQTKLNVDGMNEREILPV